MNTQVARREEIHMQQGSRYTDNRASTTQEAGQQLIIIQVAVHNLIITQRQGIK